VITDLARGSGLRVVSRTSVMRYKGVTKALPEIARELGVGAVVEGAVVRSGDRVRVTAQLIDAATDEHLWAQTFDRDVKNVLALQEELAQAISRAVQETLALRSK
jgi:TolB-like protein